MPEAPILGFILAVGAASYAMRAGATHTPASLAFDPTGRLYVTGELTVRYVKGTPIERPLLGRGRAVRDWGKYIDLEATIEDWETGEVVAKGTARFLPIRDAG